MQPNFKYNIKKNIIAKNMTNGTAILKTSKGKSTIISPFKLNIITMVKSKAIKVMGDTKGINF